MELNEKLMYQVTLKEGHFYIEPTKIVRNSDGLWLYDNPVFETFEEAMQFVKGFEDEQ